MNKNNWFWMGCFSFISLLITNTALASLPKFTIVPSVPGSNFVRLSINGTAKVTYVVTNKLSSTKTLTVQPVAGMTQDTGGSNNPCQSPFTLGPGASCSLNLKINASQLPPGVHDLGPTVCIGSSHSSCSLPSPNEKLQVSVGSLSLSSSTLILAKQGLLFTASKARQLIITNHASFAIANVSYSVSPQLPANTRISPTTCGTIPAGGSCVLTITPGDTPSTPASSALIEPTPSVLTVQGDSGAPITANIIVLTYNNFYQQGFVFALDDTTPISQSVGIKVAAKQNNTASVHGGLVWDNGSGAVTVGVYDDSTSPCSGSYDGACNTAAIVTTLKGPPEQLPINSFAASLCANYQIDSSGNSPCTEGSTCYSNWYLPSICEMGPAINEPWANCIPGTPNMVDNLGQLISSQCSGLQCLSGYYWSSTEFSVNPAGTAWALYFNPGSSSIHNLDNKFLDLFVRCARAA
ncbi:DUF1566 domain-containing protein [Legionella bononiensis]|uniref:DUF1566 domain-containing protein n=1 Tax=Legionella bononiensis TaxID=2793102 RepID=A0ABS1WD74_9GAMM|nr:DUF1566 domain-containing protein [Legionella bononiensis]MBL7481200.1 DUF1566 domain-containing protein [Legionella bononiensis]MBL7527306.1 DUF1566 domain-containing protein [Legionella bononiensis]MBL7562275.1 DUF1566 domain-containing protein [Legionella bononiensis]